MKKFRLITDATVVRRALGDGLIFSNSRIASGIDAALLAALVALAVVKAAQQNQRLGI